MMNNVPIQFRELQATEIPSSEISLLSGCDVSIPDDFSNHNITGNVSRELSSDGKALAFELTSVDGHRLNVLNCQDFLSLNGSVTDNLKFILFGRMQEQNLVEVILTEKIKDKLQVLDACREEIDHKRSLPPFTLLAAVQELPLNGAQQDPQGTIFFRKCDNDDLIETDSLSNDDNDDIEEEEADDFEEAGNAAMNEIIDEVIARRGVFLETSEVLRTPTAIFEILTKLEENGTVTFDEIAWFCNDYRNEYTEEILRGRFLLNLRTKTMRKEDFAFHAGAKKGFLITKENIVELAQWAKENRFHYLAAGFAQNSDFTDLLFEVEPTLFFDLMLLSIDEKDNRTSRLDFFTILKNKLSKDELESIWLKVLLKCLETGEDINQRYIFKFHKINPECLKILIERAKQIKEKSKNVQLIGEGLIRFKKDLPKDMVSDLKKWSNGNKDHSLAKGWHKVGESVLKRDKIC